MKYECEAGHMIDPAQQCYHCGAFPGPHSECKGKKPVRPVAPTWHPIETAPTDGREILAFKPRVGSVIVRWLDADHIDAEEISEFHEAWNHASVEGLTHWMPLPPPPENAGA